MYKQMYVYKLENENLKNKGKTKFRPVTNA